MSSIPRSLREAVRERDAAVGIEELYWKSMQEIAPRITVDSKVRFGRPVIEGTRVPVDLLVGKLAGGMTIEHVADEYGVTREDVLAALAYAARLLAEEQVRAVE